VARRDVARATPRSTRQQTIFSSASLLSDALTLIWLPVLIALLGLPLLFASFRSFDRLVQHLRAHHALAWEEEGCPRPFLSFGGKEWNMSLASSIASWRCSIAWVFRSPGWTVGDAEGKRHLRRLRWFVVLWNLGIMPLFLATLMLSAQLSAR
jgi:hypothetical protein